MGAAFVAVALPNCKTTQGQLSQFDTGFNNDRGYGGYWSYGNNWGYGSYWGYGSDGRGDWDSGDEYEEGYQKPRGESSLGIFESLTNRTT